MAANNPFISPWPPYPLPLRRTQSTQPADAALIQTLAGNAATTVGHVNGTPKVGDATNPAPVSPSGQRGHDHSGGYFGRPFIRSIGTWYFGNHNTYEVAPNNDIAAAPGMGELVLETPDEGASTTSFVSTSAPVPVWVPPCDPDVGAYRQLGFQLYVDYEADRGTISVQAGDRLDFEIRNAHANITPGTLAARIYSDTLSGITTNSQKLIESTGGIELFPGALNMLTFQLKLSRDATAGNRQAYMELLSFELGVLP